LLLQILKGEQMRKLSFLFLIGISTLFQLTAFESEVEVGNIAPDLTYLVADLKYNDSQGVQICEVQPGRMSRFIGIDFIHQEEGMIVRRLAEVLKSYHHRGWFLINDIRDPLAADALTAIGWRGFETIDELLDDAEFQAIASLEKQKGESISDFGGILFVRQSSISPYDQFKEMYPNILILDDAMRGYCGDKLKTSVIFNEPQLEKFKPAWNLYPKAYSRQLAKQIAEDLRSDYLVIKPRKGAKGYGVIICSSHDLDATLEYILEGDENLLDDPDPSYRYWAYDRSWSFIVEAYAPSNPTPVAHLDDRLFDPTMRVVYVLAHTDGQIHLHFLGSYWKLPEMSLDQEGALNDLHKSCGKLPYFSEVDVDVDAEVQRQVGECFYFLYEAMLQEKQKLGNGLKLDKYLSR